MSVTVRKLSYGIGAEIVGADLSRAMSDADIAQIRQAWIENCILLIRGQDITPEQHIAFSARFGPLDDHAALYKYRHPQHAEIFIVTTRPNADGSPSDTRETGVNWHSDLSYTTRPAMGSLLHCLEIPEIGGDTMFTNMYRAYDSLSDGFKTLIEPLQAVHDYAWAIHDTEKGRNSATADAHKKVNPPVVQPVVRVHPETGRKLLYVNHSYTIGFDGLTEAESRPLLGYLLDHGHRPEFTCRFRWKVGSIALWDNRCTHHYPVNDYHGHRRVMHRITLAGDVPAG